MSTKNMRSIINSEMSNPYENIIFGSKLTLNGILKQLYRAQKIMIRSHLYLKLSFGYKIYLTVLFCGISYSINTFDFLFFYNFYSSFSIIMISLTLRVSFFNFRRSKLLSSLELNSSCCISVSFLMSYFSKTS